MRSDCKSAQTEVMFIGICNPDALNSRIFNPVIALQMLIFNADGLQIRPNVKIRPNATIIALQMLILNAVGLQIRPNVRK